MKVFSYQHSAIRGALVALVGVAFAACNIIGGGGETEPKFKLSNLQSLWHETQVKDSEHYVRFTTEQSDETGFLLGREWDEADDVYESDLLESRETLGHPGNGWFKYQFEVKDGGLTEIHLMDNQGAEIPKVYVVTKLTDTVLEYYEKDWKDNKFYFEKVVETKK